MAGVKGSDVDALWTALRPRILGLSTGGSGVTRVGPQGPAGPKGVTWRGAWAADTDYATGDLVTYLTAGLSTLTYICIEANTSIGGSPPTVGGDVRWHELGPGYLIIDGSRAMTGDLDLGTHMATNQVAARFVPTVVPGTEYAAAAGDVSWDASALLDQLVMHCPSDGGLVEIPGLGVYVKVRNYEHPFSATLTKGTVVTIGGGPGTHVVAKELDDVMEDGVNPHNGLGLMITDAPNDGTGWACVEGLAFGIDTSAFSENGRVIWWGETLDQYDDETPHPLKGYPYIFVGRVVMSAAQGTVFVQFDWRPKLDDLSNVDVDQNIYDVLMWYPGAAEGQPYVWRSRPAAQFTSLLVTEDYSVVDRDVILLCTAPLTITLPDDPCNRLLRIHYEDGSGVITIESSTTNISGESSVTLVALGETIDLQGVDGGVWRVL